MSQSLCLKIQNELINKYNSGISISQLEKDYNITKYLIKKCLIKNNIIIRSKIISLNTNEICLLYEKYRSFNKVAKYFNVDYSVIKRILIKNNVEINSKPYRKYALNELYFDNIDSEDKAYFLGLLYADGCVSKNGYNVCLSLKNNDKLILEKFSQILFNKNLVFDKKSNQYPYNTYSLLNINSKIFNASLKSIGCVSAKSLILEYPKLNENLNSHFIRGYMDGDGHISQKNKIFVITSTLNFCQKAAEILNQTGAHIFIYKYKNIYRLTSHGRNNITKILNWLYKDSSIYLERKYSIYNNIINESTPYYSELEKDTIIQLNDKNISISNIALLLNKSKNGIKKFLNKNNK